MEPELRVSVEGALRADLAQGRCIDVEGAEITVASDTPNAVAHGTYHRVQ